MALKIRQTSFAQQCPGIIGRAFPSWPVTGGDAGVGTAGRLAQRRERLLGIGGGHALEAERGGGIEEAIRAEADIEGSRAAGEPDTAPGRGGHYGGTGTELHR